MRLCRCTYSESLLIVQGLGPDDSSKAALLYTASWMRRSSKYQANVNNTLNELESLGIEQCYVIQSQGNDEVEEHLLDSIPVRGNREPRGDGENVYFPSVEILRYQEDNTKHMFLVRDIFDQIAQENATALTLFVSGDRSSVGKSTICLSIIAALVREGISTDRIAYIKPVTQCEAEQPVVRYCEDYGIKCEGVGPVVFYKGFTRAFLNGETEPTDVMLQRIRRSVEALKKRRSFVLIDGVGYPAVGSICGISNAQVAKLLDVPVLLVGKSGVGDAVDSHNLNAAYFQHSGVTVLGSIFNKLSLEGFYNLEACKTSIDSYFHQYGNGQKAYGYLPLLTDVNTGASTGIAAEPDPKRMRTKRKNEVSTAPPESESESAEYRRNGDSVSASISDAFAERVDIPALFLDVFKFHLWQRGECSRSEVGCLPDGHGDHGDHGDYGDDGNYGGFGNYRDYGGYGYYGADGNLYDDKRAYIESRLASRQISPQLRAEPSRPSVTPKKRSREEIEAFAVSAGARGS